VAARFSQCRVPPLAVMILASFLAGMATLPLREGIAPPARDLEKLEGMGQTVLVGTFGGLRALAADLLWIRTNYYWENENLGLAETTGRAVTRLQPDLPYFWIQTARMIVYDMPVWRFGSRKLPPKSVETRIRREQAERGIELLDEAEQFLPDSPAIPGEKARIYWTVLGDTEKAAEEYKEPYEKPGAPVLYARMRAVILMDEGREREALSWLEQVLANLDPARDPAQYSLMMEYVDALRAGRNPREETGVGKVSPLVEEAACRGGLTSDRSERGKLALA